MRECNFKVFGAFALKQPRFFGKIGYFKSKELGLFPFTASYFYRKEKWGINIRSKRIFNLQASETSLGKLYLKKAFGKQRRS